MMRSSSSSDPQQQQQEQQQRSPRFVWWCALMVFASVSLGALVSDINNRSGYTKERHDKWAMSVCSISLTCGVLAVAAHFAAPSTFVSEQPEGLLASLNLILWVAGLPAIMDPAHVLATDGAGGVLNANLYFFAWAAFFASLYISGHFAQSVSGTVDLSSTPKKLAMWLVISATSIVLLASSSKWHSNNNCSNRDLTECNRNAYAISLGAIVGFAALVIILMAYKDMLRLVVETATAVLALVLYSVGVGLITFGQGPGVDIGNQYFSTWIGFSVCVFLAFTCVKEFLHERGETTTMESTTTKPEISTTPEGPMETGKVEGDDNA